MKRHVNRKNIARVLVTLLGLFILSQLVWAFIAGPVTVLRIWQYGDTDIDDYSHYPGRTLTASQAPVNFDRQKTDLSLPPSIAAEFDARDLRDLLAANDTIAFVVLQGNTIRFEEYFQGHDQSAISQAFSASKSITSALIGIAIQDGYLDSVEQPITDLVPELEASGYGNVTLAHLLTMQSGTAYVENDNPFREHVIFNFTPNLESEILDIPMEDPPGEVWRYKSGDNALLALALDRALGAQSITGYAQTRLWEPLGMAHDGVWTIDHEEGGLEKTWCCLAASAVDFAKIGRLYLGEGRLNGEQILPAGWVAESTRPAIPTDRWPEDFASAGLTNYGYQWWLLSDMRGDFLGLGKDGQYLYVNPSADLSIVRLGWRQGEMFTSDWIALFQAIADQLRL